MQEIAAKAMDLWRSLALASALCCFVGDVERVSGLVEEKSVAI